MKQRWLTSNDTSNDTIETIIRDGSGAKIDVLKSKASDYKKIVFIIQRKYGLDIIKQRQDKDLAWLNNETS